MNPNDTLYNLHTGYYKRFFNTKFNETFYNEINPNPTNLTHLNNCINLLHHYYPETLEINQETFTTPLTIPQLTLISNIALKGITLQDVTAGEYLNLPLQWVNILTQHLPQKTSTP